MAGIGSLIDEAKRDDDVGRFATVQLIKMGARAIDDLVTAVKESSDPGATRLSRVLAEISDADAVPRLLELLDDRNMDLAMAGFRALGKSRSQKAVKPLADYVADDTKRATRRQLAAAALGNLGFKTSVPVLAGVVDEAVDSEEPELAIAAIIALAKLGDHEKAPVLIELTTYEDDEVVRTHATAGLQYVVGVGELTALKRALEDEYYEVKRAAVDAVFYLGLPESVNVLIQVANDDDDTVSNNARIRINDLLGEELSTDVKVAELRKAWEARRSKFGHDACNRLGRPIRFDDLIELLGDPDVRGRILEELRIITGVDFRGGAADSDNSRAKARVTSWWKEHGHNFEEGQLYKWGFKQDVTIVR